MNLETLASLYVALNFIAALLTLGLSIYISWKQGFKNAFTFVLLLSLITMHSLINGSMAISPGLEIARFFENLRWLSLATIPPLMLIFILDYTGQKRLLAPKWLMLYFTIPLATQVIVWTNAAHGWMVQPGYDQFIQIGSLYLLGERVFGVWFSIYALWGYLLIFVGLSALIHDALTSPQLAWQQFAWLFIGFFMAIVLSMVDTFKLVNPSWFKLLPFGFMLMSISFSLAIMRGQFINVLPIARGYLIEVLQAAVIIADRNRRVVELNPAASALIGKPKQMSIGQPASHVFERWDNLAKIFQSANEISTLTLVVRDSSGKYYDAQISPLHSWRHQSAGWVIVLHDITRLKEAETRASQLATVIEQAQETVVITGLDGAILYANPHFEETTGYSVEEALGQNPRILQSGRQDQQFYTFMWKKITKGESWSGTFINKRKDGSLYHEAATIFPIKNEFGETTQYAAVKRNITEQVEAENALRKSEHQYRLLADNAQDVIWTMDFESHFTYISPSVEQLLGYTAEETMHLPIQQMFTPNSYAIVLKDFDEMQANINAGTVSTVRQHEQIRKDGSSIWVEIITTLLHDENGIPLGILGVTRDISERKKVEQSLQEYARQQRLLNEITQAAIEQNDFETMLQMLADHLGELLEADGCYITLWDEEKQIPIPKAAFGSFRETYLQQQFPKPGDPSITKSVLNLGKPLAIADAFETPHLDPKIAAQFPTRSSLALPLIANRQKLGAALIAFNQPREFSEAEIHIGEQAAQQIALAVLKIKLLEEAQERAREAETLREASAAIITSLQKDDTIERILEQLSYVVPYDSASVLLTNGLEMEIVGAHGFENKNQIIGLRFAVTAQTPNKVIYETLEPYILSDAQQEYSEFRKPQHKHIHGWMGIPLIFQNRLIGMLTLDSRTPGRFNENHARLASAFANQVAIALENARLFEETQRLAAIDSLTNIYNRRAFMELARAEFERSRRYHKYLSILMFDVDHFKQVNDTYGHLIGDQVLQIAAFICQQNLRSADIVGRYGGEEFIILLPETRIHSHSEQPEKYESRPAYTVAERLRKTIAQNIMATSAAEIRITISMGLAEIEPEHTTIETIIDNADQALLQAKSQGRNRIVIYNHPQNHA